MSYKKGDLYIWGAGHYGALTAFDCKIKNIKIKAFIDVNADKIKNKLELPVLTPEEVLFNRSESYIIVGVQNEHALLKIIGILQEAGFRENEHYEYSELMPGTKIRKYFLRLDKEKQPESIKEIIEFFEQNAFSVFPYKFIFKHKEPAVFYDSDCKMHYVLRNDKKLYMPSEYDKNETANYYRSLCIEQDKDSPHCYETENYIVKNGDIIADIGAAEGIWALDNVQRASKIYVFESEQKWIKALEKTFEPWKDKVEIINKFVSNATEENKITLDDFFMSRDKINFLKADIEGAELELLLGAKNILEKQSDIKLLLCAYHKENDEIMLKDFCERYNFMTEHSKGYMLFCIDKELKEPYVRRGLIRAEKLERRAKA